VENTCQAAFYQSEVREWTHSVNNGRDSRYTRCAVYAAGNEDIDTCEIDSAVFERRHVWFYALGTSHIDEQVGFDAHCGTCRT